MVMDKSPAKILDIFIKEHMSPLMKNNGFLKNGKTWTKQNGEVTYVVNIQSNKWNTKGAAIKIFINYGLFSPERFKALFRSSPLPTHTKEYDCYIRERLVSNENSEIWTISTEAEDVSNDGIVNRVNDIIFPYFDTQKKL